ncbi:MAG TPA: glycine cleavage system protein H [Nitrososphaerales archaeon]|nr:glycine cleavage system protein H [Nitrososphaerales archaeon]
MIISNCRFADDVLYDTASNTWVRFNEDGTATVGINTILAWLGGPIDSLSFKPVGAVVEQGRALGAVESPRHFDTVRSPITGKILEMNEALAGNPRLLNRDPYGDGWFAKLEPLKRQQEIATVKSPAMARDELQARIAELKIRCFAEFPDNEMYEIGTECSAVLVRLDELLSHSPTGTIVHMVSDDPSSEVEMIRWSDRTGNQVLETRREGNLVHYVVKKTQP